jgi:hypothetical protein
VPEQNAPTDAIEMKISCQYSIQVPELNEMIDMSDVEAELEDEEEEVEEPVLDANGKPKLGKDGKPLTKKVMKKKVKECREPDIMVCLIYVGKNVYSLCTLYIYKTFRWISILQKKPFRLIFMLIKPYDDISSSSKGPLFVCWKSMEKPPAEYEQEEIEVEEEVEEEIVNPDGTLNCKIEVRKRSKRKSWTLNPDGILLSVKWGERSKIVLITIIYTDAIAL